jgi:hypothetical protein
VLRVLTLKDETIPIATAVEKESTNTYRYNFRKFYEGKEITNGITAMMTEHLRKSGLFKDVIGQDNRKPADYELSGTIADYRCKALVNSRAENISGVFGILGALTVPIGPIVFGGIGAAVTSGYETEIETSVRLNNLTLRQAGTTNILWQASIGVQTNCITKWYAATHPRCYVYPDYQLRIVVNEVVQGVGAKLQPPLQKSRRLDLRYMI